MLLLKDNNKGSKREFRHAAKLRTALLLFFSLRSSTPKAIHPQRLSLRDTPERNRWRAATGAFPSHPGYPHSQQAAKTSLSPGKWPFSTIFYLSLSALAEIPAGKLKDLSGNLAAVMAERKRRDW